jgi:hypothetical protein
MPDIKFNFPLNDKKGQTSKFQFIWLSRWSWLAYSTKEDGAFCKLCVAFGKSEEGVNNHKLGALVLKKFNDWKHAKETFNNHMKLLYHLRSIAYTDNFLKINRLYRL